MSKFFIHRPIVAMVISIVLVIVGAVTIAGLSLNILSMILAAWPSKVTARGMVNDPGRCSATMTRKPR